MKIDRIEIYHVAMPLISPWRTAYGEDADIHSVLCRLCSGSTDGWGEASPLAAPCYSPEWGGGIFATIRDHLAPRIMGRDVRSGEHLASLLAIFKGNNFAKAALDTAWWSLASRLANQPLFRMLGASREQVPVGADFGVMDRVEDLVDCIGSAVEQGFPRVKLKFRPGWDIDMLAAVRSQFPTQIFHIDCNSGYRWLDAALFRQIDQFDLAMVEQPLQHGDLIDHAWLQTQIRTPICLDESITDARVAEQAIGLRSCRYVNIKPGRVGGLTNAVRIHDICQAARIPCWVGGMLESAVGSAHCVALAMLENFTYPADIFPSSRFYHQDLADTPLELETSSRVPSVSAHDELPLPNLKRLARLTIQKEVLP